MALINCPDCKSEVSDRAAACPRCGHPIAAAPTSLALTSGADDLSQRALAKHAPITEKVPQAQRALLHPGEEAIHFAYIAQAGGCASGGSANQWLLVSNQRVLYAGSIKEKVGTSEKYTSTTGGIPLHKISFVGTKTSRTTEGCSTRVFNLLVINSSGGSIDIVVPNPEEARRTQALIESIIQ